MSSPVKNVLNAARSRADLARRVAELEEEVQECRQLNLRLAELTDVVMELLVPMAERDEAALADAIERYRASVSDPGPR